MSRKPPKKAATTHDIKDYTTFDGDIRRHAIACPGMYIGNINQTATKSYIMDGPDKIVTKEINVPEGFQRIYIEVISNAIDNCIKSKNRSVNPGTIDVSMDNESITITNYGLGIPVEPLPSNPKIYLPEMIFAHPMSGSNLNTTKVNKDGSISIVEKKDREGSGVNGLGVKLVGIYSKRVAVDLGDGKNRYTQEYHNNLGLIQPPTITKCSKKPWVTVRYWPDLAYFGYKDSFPPEVQQLFMKSVADASFVAGVKCTFNDHNFDFTKLANYAKLYFGDTPIATYISDDLSIAIAATPKVHQHCCFTNGIYNRDGGIHYNKCIEKVCEIIREQYKDQEGNYLIDPAQIRNNISILVSYQVTNPIIEGQSKNILRGPWTKRTKNNAIKFTDASIQKICKVLDSVLGDIIHAADLKKLTKTDGDKKSYVEIDKLLDANWVLNKMDRTEDTALFVGEGASATSLLKAILQYMRHGSDGNGVLTLKGKILNVRNSKVDRIIANKEIANIKQSLGLKEGMTFKTQSDIYNNLRYGAIVLACDADVDGKHIIGLFLNYLHFFFPSLLRLKFVYFLRTPIVIVYKNPSKKDILYRFYTEEKYREWQEKNKNVNRGSVRYIKGLGTLNKLDMKQELVDSGGLGNRVLFEHDSLTDEKILLAFDKSLSNKRKDWIMSYDQSKEFESLNILPISFFIDNEFIQFSVSDNIRSLPHAFDNLKDSQRKIIWSALEYWKTQQPEQKTVDFASYVSNKTHYHHGPAALVEAAVGMAQDFTSSNNLPLLQGSGQMGSRFASGDDAAQPRYTFITKSWCLDYLFPTKNRQLEVNQIIETQEAEPHHLFPILPVSLFNGCHGIGTGFRITLMPYNPLDVIKWYQTYLKGGAPSALVPWFRGFKGSVSIKVFNKKTVELLNDQDDVEEVEDKDDVFQPDNVGIVAGKKTLVVEGKYTVNGDTIHITEIPIGRSTDSYTKYYQKLQKEGLFKQLIQKNTDVEIDMKLKGVKDIENMIPKLRLVRRFGLSNIYMLDFNLKPIYFNDVSEYCKYFAKYNLEFYKDLKLREISNYKKSIVYSQKRLNFFKDIIHGKIKFSNNDGLPRNKEEILNNMKELGHDLELAKENFKITGLSKNILEKLQNSINTMESELQKLEKMSEQDLWLSDIAEFEREYLKYYPQ